MILPKVAIVGRPNVGKSALFNHICGKRIAIVDPTEGVTRDRLYATCHYFDSYFDLIDTGGIDPRSSDPFQEVVGNQTRKAIEEADALLLVVDGSTGPLALDQELAELMHKQFKPIFLVVNKIDQDVHKERIHLFHNLGIPEVLPVSALHGYGMNELLTLLISKITCAPTAPATSALFPLAIVGRANVGKSTLLNALLGEERSTVSPLPGTTRDAIDTQLTYNENAYLLIDTAGIRRKKTHREAVEAYAAMRTQKTIERAKIVLFVIDAQEGITAEEKKILSEIESAGCGCLLLLNKWDTAKGFRMEHALQHLRLAHPFLAHCPMLCMSALQERNIEKIFPLIERVRASMMLRITTHQLNKFVERAIQLNHPPMINGKRLRIYYLTQVATCPPQFALFINHKELLSESFKRYLINQFRKEFEFEGVPLIFYIRSKENSVHASDLGRLR